MAVETTEATDDSKSTFTSPVDGGPTPDDIAADLRAMVDGPDVAPIATTPDAEPSMDHYIDQVRESFKPEYTPEQNDAVLEQYNTAENKRITRLKNGQVFPARAILIKHGKDYPIDEQLQDYNEAVVDQYYEAQAAAGVDVGEARKVLAFEKQLHEQLSEMTTLEQVYAFAEGQVAKTVDGKKSGRILNNTRADAKYRSFRPIHGGDSWHWITSDLVNQRIRQIVKWPEGRMVAPDASEPTAEPAVVDSEPVAKDIEPTVVDATTGATEIPINLDNLRSASSERETRRDLLVAERMRRGAERELGLEPTETQKAERQQAIIQARERFRAAETVQTTAENTKKSEFIGQQTEGLAKFLAPDRRGGYRIDANPENPVESAAVIRALLSRVGREDTFFEERKEKHGKDINIVARAFKTRDPHVVIVERWNTDTNQFLGIIAMKGDAELALSKADTKSSKIAARTRGHLRNIGHALRGSHADPSPQLGLGRKSWETYDAYAQNRHDAAKIPVSEMTKPTENGHEIWGQVDQLRTMLGTMTELGYSEAAIDQVKIPNRKARGIWQQLLNQRTVSARPQPAVIPIPVSTKGHPYQARDDRKPGHPYQTR